MAKVEADIKAATERPKASPEKIWDKIVPGKIERYIADNTLLDQERCLLSQFFALDDTKTVEAAINEFSFRSGRGPRLQTGCGQLSNRASFQLIKRKPRLADPVSDLARFFRMLYVRAAIATPATCTFANVCSITDHESTDQSERLRNTQRVVLEAERRKPRRWRGAEGISGQEMSDIAVANQTSARQSGCQIAIVDRRRKHPSRRPVLGQQRTGTRSDGALHGNAGNGDQLAGDAGRARIGWNRRLESCRPDPDGQNRRNVHPSPGDSPPGKRPRHHSWPQGSATHS